MHYNKQPANQSHHSHYLAIDRHYGKHGLTFDIVLVNETFGDLVDRFVNKQNY